ncbi:hypothetical protein M4914_19175, partial [Streptomyces somaliensis DSM 40738]
MSRTDARRRGAGTRALWVLVLVGLLACAGPGDRPHRDPYGDRARAADAVADRARPSDRAVVAEAPAAAPTGDGRPPGCRDGSGAGGVVPAVPPRG